MNKQFSKISENNVRLIFKVDPDYAEEYIKNRGYTKKQVEDTIVRITPSEFAEVGIPYDMEDHEMMYSHTEIRNRTTVIHVMGGVAYLPARPCPKYANVKIIDHDNEMRE